MSKLTLHFFKFFCALSLCITGAAMAACPPPGTTISGTPADESQLGIADDGTTIAVWREFDGVNTLIKSAFLIKGGSWSSPVTITSFLDDDGFATPQIAVSGSSGNAVAIWEQLDTGSSTSFVFASVRPADTGTWTAPVQLDIGSAFDSVRSQQIAINTVGLNDDYAVAIWQTDNGGGNRFLQSARLHILGFTPGTWSSPPDEVVPATIDDLSVPNIVVDTTGIAYAIWENDSTPDPSVETATLPLDGSVWSPVTTLSPTIAGDAFGAPEIALGSTGFVAATWFQTTVAAITFVQATTYQAGSWDLTPDTISTGNVTTRELDMDVDLANNVVAIWREGNGAARTVKSAYFVSGTWASPLQVSTLGVPSLLPEVALIAGKAYAVWSSLVSGVNIVEFATSDNGAAWSTPCTNISPLTDSSNPVQIAVDPTGYGVIAWRNGTLQVIQATFFFSPPPPTVTAVSPTSGSINGQNSVLITGTFFFDVQSVQFGLGNFAPSFIVVSPTEILAVAPPGPLAPPSVDVIVTTLTGTSPANPPGDLYSFINPICWQR
jgi:hypothetical protein